MPERTWKMGLKIALYFLGFGIWTIMAWAGDVPRITKEEMKSMLGNPEVIILDVRAERDWEGSKEKIQGAVREDPSKQTKSWAEKYSQEKTLILYCA
jgi:hypothetical protein